MKFSKMESNGCTPAKPGFLLQIKMFHTMRIRLCCKIPDCK